MSASTGMRRNVEITPPARAHFTGKEPNESEARPLTETKWAKQLSLRVFKSGIERVNTREWHRIPRDGEYAEPGERSRRLNHRKQLLAVSS